MDGNEQPNTPAPWQYVPDATAVQSIAIPPTGADGSITWTASEFVAHDKSAGWFGILAVAAVVAAAIIWLVTKDVISAIVIVAAAGMLAAFARREPRELMYRLDQHGLQIDRKTYDYESFRSFSIMTEGSFDSIAFSPLIRFAPLLTIYYDPRDQDKIVQLLSQFIPLQPRKSDPIDRLMWRIRF